MISKTPGLQPELRVLHQGTKKCKLFINNMGEGGRLGLKHQRKVVQQCECI